MRAPTRIGQLGQLGRIGQLALVGLIGQLAVAVSLGCLVIGFGLVLPMLELGNDLVDLNLAKALGQGIALRLGLVLLIACSIVAVATPRWIEHRAATTAALGAVALAALDRLLMLPRVYQAWSRVDLVADRPHDRLQQAQELAQWHGWLLLGVGALLVSVLAFAVLGRIRLAASTATPSRAESPAAAPA
jgi:hypothetical protein